MYNPKQLEIGALIRIKCPTCKAECLIHDRNMSGLNGNYKGIIKSVWKDQRAFNGKDYKIHYEFKIIPTNITGRLPSICVTSEEEHA